MANNLKDELESLRTEKLRELGYLCYNLSLGSGAYPEFGTIVNSMQAYAQNMTRARMNDGGADLHRFNEMLSASAEELGCVCFNRYVDKKPLPDGAQEICTSITEINSRIISAVKAESAVPADIGRPPMDGLQPNAAVPPVNAAPANAGAPPVNTAPANVTEQRPPLPGFGGVSPENGTVLSFEEQDSGSDLKMSYPFGMEPIPTNAKVCVCGYRNKEYARFCGKCGAKL